jgi:hypothetical protein
MTHATTPDQWGGCFLWGIGCYVCWDMTVVTNYIQVEFIWYNRYYGTCNNVWMGTHVINVMVSLQLCMLLSYLHGLIAALYAAQSSAWRDCSSVCCLVFCMA